MLRLRLSPNGQRVVPRECFPGQSKWQSTAESGSAGGAWRMTSGALAGDRTMLKAAVKLGNGGVLIAEHEIC